jgi:hypothetical protein
MANRHKMKKGGRVAYAGGESNVAKEAREMKSGGKVDGAIAGCKSKGGRISKARGGGVGSDKHPFSSAHRG